MKYSGKFLSSLALCALLMLPAGRAVAVEAGFKESIEKLKLLFTPAAGPEGQAPTPSVVLIGSEEDGTLIITQHVGHDRAKFHFTSAGEQTWRVHPSDLDAKRVIVQTDPIGVFIAVKKDVKRVMVERHELKTRAASGDKPEEQWSDDQKFASSFVVIPTATPQQADEAAAIIRQIIKTTPKTK